MYYREPVDLHVTQISETPCSTMYIETSMHMYIIDTGGDHVNFMSYRGLFNMYIRTRHNNYGRTTCAGKIPL